MSTQVLADVVTQLKYSRFLPEHSRRELWPEIVERNKAMHLRKFAGHQELCDGIEAAYELVLQRQVLPSMRSLQFGGHAIESNNVRIYNCAYLPLSDVLCFAEAIFLLLSGCGVGYSVQHQHIERLPEVQQPQTSAAYVIADSIQGWADAVKALLSAYLCGAPLPDFDYSRIRPQGAPLRTAGGLAPGPDPLRGALTAVQAVLAQKQDGSRLSSVECHDLMCHLAECVLAGGIRRSSLLALFSKDDAAMLNCKSGSWWETAPQRARANNSVALQRGQISEHEFKELWRAVEASGAGEPGIYFTNDLDWGVNPCCVSGDTVVRTSEGPRTVRQLVGTPFKAIVGGRAYATESQGFFQSGSKRVYQVLTKGGRSCKTTADHRFLAQFQHCAELAHLTQAAVLYYLQHYLEVKFEVRGTEVWVTGGFWCPLEQLEIGSKVYMSDGTADALFTIEAFGEEPVYDVTVETVHEFDGNGFRLHNCEIALRPFQFCVAGSTPMITAEGIFPIEQLIGGEVRVWNGEQWSSVRPQVTQLDAALVRVHLSDGSHLDCTPEHRFSVYEGGQYVERMAGELERGVRLEQTTVGAKTGVDHQSAYELGRAYGNVYDQSSLLSEMRESNAALLKMSKYSTKALLQFFAGWLDTDGKRQLDGACLYTKVGRAAQLLLTLCGVPSILGETFVKIPNSSAIKCRRFEADNVLARPQTVERLERLDGRHTVYCFDEPHRHKALFANVLTHQCNLVEVNVSNVESQADLERRVRAAALLGTLQASYTEFPYLRPIWQRTTKADALLGVGITGVGSGKVLALDLKAAAKVAVEENARVAPMVGVNQSARITTLKPAGTSSLVLGCASGIHAWHAPHYIRRLRVGKVEPFYQYMKQFAPGLVEDDVHNRKQAVVSFPISAPEGSMFRSESAIELLERVHRFNVDWVANGHRHGANRHNVSATVSVKPDEWREVGEWMWRHQEDFNGLAVLPYDGGSYKQAPFEECSAETIAAMVEQLRGFDIAQVRETEDLTDFLAESACAGGKCELRK